MCGIIALLHYGAASNGPSDVKLTDPQLERIISLLEARGPDYKSAPLEIEVDLELPHRASLQFKASVLHLRGEQMCAQPARDEHSNVLLFNGEIYEFANDMRNMNMHIDTRNGESDTSRLMQILEKAPDRRTILSVLASIVGPYAIVYWQHRTRTLYFGRDVFGRRSLCIHQDPIGKRIVISSVASAEANFAWKEVTTDGIHQIDLNHDVTNGIYECATNLWHLDSIFPPTNKCVPQRDETICGKSDFFMVDTPLRVKLNSDLLSPLYSQTFVLDLPPTGQEEELLIEFHRILDESLKRRINLEKKSICQDCLTQGLSSQCAHSSVAIAFSGGIDSTVLALAASKHIPSHQAIDLLNVAFGPNAPDRLTAKTAYLELIERKPDREWNLVCIDISLSDLERDRASHIKHLIAPLKTVIDDSIGCALWYISRGTGRKLSSIAYCSCRPEFNETLGDHIKFKQEENASYRCPARILIVGMGIDEQLGGYTSHRAAWSEGGIIALYQEITFQMRRLSTRNLGRDDRVGGDHGRDLKTPFLDESLVDFLNGLPVNYKMDLSLSPGLGDKIILRRYAKYILGLKNSWNHVKRAMQFGTRIAKLECKKEQGHEICTRLL